MNRVKPVKECFDLKKSEELYEDEKSFFLVKILPFLIIFTSKFEAQLASKFVCEFPFCKTK
jgi:hypothetical protein